MLNNSTFHIIFSHKLLSLFLILCISILSVPTPAESKPNKKYGSIVIDADSGMVLSQSNADKTLHPASLTKMMTLLITFEALDRGDVTLNDRITISRRAASMVPSKLDLPAGSRIKIKDAIYSLVTKSANDVAVALAEHLGGSESRFGVIMTNRARSIGMRKTRFKNASGLHHPSQVTSPRDMAKLGQYILQRYPHYYKYFSTRSFTYKGKTYRNHNRLLESYKGMDGFKTGYINASGFNLVASARRDGRRLIGVVFGGRTGKTRNAHMAAILDQGFAKAKRTRITAVLNPPKPPRKPGMGIAEAIVTNKKPDYASLSALNQKQSDTKIHVPAKDAQRKEIIKSYKVANATLNNDRLKEIATGNKPVTMTKISTETLQTKADHPSKRVETALMSAAIHKREIYPVDYSNEVKSRGESLPNKPARPLNSVGRWSVQIGAFASRLATDDALRLALTRLPSTMTNASPMAVPLRTKDGMVFRARLGGLTRDEAYKACNYIKDCMPVAPLRNKSALKKN